MKIELMFPQDIILEEIATKECKRKSIAVTYAFCIESRDEIDWKVVNTAIVERWCGSGLGYIKNRAWKLVKEKERENEKRRLAAVVAST